MQPKAADSGLGTRRSIDSQSIDKKKLRVYRKVIPCTAREMEGVTSVGSFIVHGFGSLQKLTTARSWDS